MIRLEQICRHQTDTATPNWNPMCLHPDVIKLPTGVKGAVEATKQLNKDGFTLEPPTGNGIPRRCVYDKCRGCRHLEAKS